MTSTFIPPGYTSLLDLIDNKGREMFPDDWTGNEDCPVLSVLDHWRYRKEFISAFEKKKTELGIRSGFGSYTTPEQTKNLEEALDEIKSKLAPLKNEIEEAWKRWTSVTQAIRAAFCSKELIARHYKPKSGLGDIGPNLWLDDKCEDWFFTGLYEGSIILISTRPPSNLNVIPLNTEHQTSDTLQEVEKPDRPHTKKEAENAYCTRVKEWPKNTPPPSRSDDETWGKEHGLSRDRVRHLRINHAPKEWSKKGRRKAP